MNLTRAINIITTHCGHRTALLRTLDEQTDTGLRAAAYDKDGPSAGTDQPPRPDPTGETATRPDRARTLRADLLKAEARIEMAVTQELWSPHYLRIHQAAALLRAGIHLDPPAAHAIDTAARTIQMITVETLPQTKLNPADLAHLAADGEPGCQSCSRIRWWNDPDYNQGRPTNLGGLLPESWLLCRPCYRFAINNDRPPTTKELTWRKDDPRGRWKGEGRKKAA